MHKHITNILNNELVSAGMVNGELYFQTLIGEKSDKGKRKTMLPTLQWI